MNVADASYIYCLFSIMYWFHQFLNNIIIVKFLNIIVKMCKIYSTNAAFYSI